MQEVRPTSTQDLCAVLADAGHSRRAITLGGNFTKSRWSASPAGAEVMISTACMPRVLNYEPRDLTISVEAGLPFADLTAILAEHRQMVPLDPPYFDRATVGGVVASNSSGPRRRLYGTARDMVIGMSFAKLDGKLASSGGMVVKNVAGFDMAKLMIGSFGTLAAIATVNFKLSPMPPETRTFVMRFQTAAECVKARDEILAGVLQPAAMDALNPAAARRVGLDGFVLMLEVGGSPAVLERYSRELASAEVMASEIWTAVREFTPSFVAEFKDAHVARVSATHSQLGTLFAGCSSPVVSRAGSGVSYLHFQDAGGARGWTDRPETKQLRYVFEYGASGSNGVFGAEFEMMKAVKRLFDPDNLLNAGRLYGRI